MNIINLNLVPRAFPLKVGEKSPGNEVVKTSLDGVRIDVTRYQLHGLTSNSFPTASLVLQLRICFIKWYEKERSLKFRAHSIIMAVILKLWIILLHVSSCEMFKPRLNDRNSQRNRSQHCRAQYVACVWPHCCDVSRNVGCWLNLTIFKLELWRFLCWNSVKFGRLGVNILL